MKLLLIDIETAPNIVFAWGLWNQNIGINQIVDAGYILSWSAKWLGEDEVYFSSIYHDSKKTMLKKIHALLEKADAVIHYNGARFDIPTLNKEFVKAKLLPPSPYKQIDLLKVARRQFKFASNKLDYVAKFLGLGSKTSHRGMDLWRDCMNKVPEAWEEMMEYNKNDVLLLEKVYNVLLPWIPNHPNRNVYEDSGISCPNCGGHNLQKRGIAITKSLKYTRYQCKDCGTWSRGNKSVSKSEERAIPA